MKEQRGYTLIELVLGLMLIAILSSMAVAAYNQYVERARVARAISDIGKFHIAIQRYITKENKGYPDSLADLGLNITTDPWGNPYQYLVVEGLGNNGAVRKDENLVPVNRSYDIYSMGKDGRTETPFTSTLGRDDVVLAGDGSYFGLAIDYSAYTASGRRPIR